MLISAEDISKMVQEAQPQQVTLTREEENAKREQLRNQALKALYDNQECFVAQWILQNPFENPNDYTLRFVYHDKSKLGYDVQMVKIEGENNV